MKGRKAVGVEDALQRDHSPQLGQSLHAILEGIPQSVRSAGDRSPPADKPVDPNPLAGLKRFLRRTIAQVGAASWRSRERPAAAT